MRPGCWGHGCREGAIEKGAPKIVWCRGWVLADGDRVREEFRSRAAPELRATTDEPRDQVYGFENHGGRGTIFTGGRPINDFWQCCQDRYARKFGTQRLGDTQTRSDAGKKHCTQKRRQDGKFTMASIRRDRSEALAAQPSIPFGGRVFGHRAMSQPTLTNMCKKAEGEAFLRIFEKMQKKCDKMQAGIDHSLAAPAGFVRLSAMTTRQRQHLAKQNVQAREVLLEFGFAC